MDAEKNDHSADKKAQTLPKDAPARTSAWSESGSAAASGICRAAIRFLRRKFSGLRYLLNPHPHNDMLVNGENTDDTDSFSVLDGSGIEDFERLKLGQVDEDFERESILGSGGQANIFNARDKQIGRIVAIKCLRESCQKNAAARKNLLQEAALTARLEHPSIIPVYRLCCDEEQNLHIVMKKIRGKTFGKYLDEVRAYYAKNGIHLFEERASLARRLDIFLDVCNGLSYAHNLKVIHGDLKPDNVMIGFHHETYIIDWGVAKLLGTDGSVPRAKRVTGTPRYIAPEVACGLDYDQRADVFAMGSILFETITLNEAFSGASPQEILEHVCTGKLNPIRHRWGVGVDKALISIIRKAVANNPDERYNTIDDLAGDIRRHRNGLEILAKPDNALQRATRWMLIHKRVTRWSIQILAVVIFGLLSYNIYTGMQYELRQKRRETSLNSAYTKSLMVVTEINNQLNKVEQIVSVLASGTSFMLGLHPVEAEAGNMHEVEAPYVPFQVLAQENPPPTSLFSMHYNSRIDFTNLSYNGTQKLSQPEIEHYTQTLLPFKRQMIGFFILSCTDQKPFVGEEAYLPENMARSNYSLLWLNLTFANALSLRYPATEAYGNDFDGRQRPWYTLAQNNPDIVMWSAPALEQNSSNKVILTVAKAIQSPQREILGVASADVELDELRKIIERDVTDKYFKKLLLTHDGGILINTANPIARPQHDSAGNLVLPKFHNRELFEIMQQKKFGVESVWENERETFYIYSYLEQMQWFYVVRVDQDTIRYQDDWKSATP